MTGTDRSRRAGDGRVFISYRRGDVGGHVNALYQVLTLRMGGERVYMDVDSVELGVDWREAITDAVRDSAVVLAVIGKNWVCSTPVALELGTAFEHDVPVLPLLIGDTAFDDIDDGGETIARLRTLNARNVRPDAWERDLRPVVSRIEELTEVVRSPASPEDAELEGFVDSPTESVRLQVAERIERAVATKWAGHQINQVSFTRPSKSMSQIGG